MARQGQARLGMAWRGKVRNKQHGQKQKKEKGEKMNREHREFDGWMIVNKRGNPTGINIEVKLPYRSDYTVMRTGYIEIFVSRKIAKIFCRDNERVIRVKIVKI